MSSQPSPKPRVLITGAANVSAESSLSNSQSAASAVAIHYNGSRAEAEEVSKVCGSAPIFQADLTKVPEIIRLFFSKFRPTRLPRKQRRPFYPLQPARYHRSRLGFHSRGQPQSHFLLLPTSRQADACRAAPGELSTLVHLAASARGPNMPTTALRKPASSCSLKPSRKPSRRRLRSTPLRPA